MPLSLRNLLLSLLTTLTFTRCADLKEVRNFALASQQVMDKHRAAPFGYSTFSLDSAYIFNYLPDQLRDVDCNCAAANKADSGISNEFGVLSTYFAILAKFADPKISVNFAPMANTLPAGTYGPVNITSQEANYAANLAKGLTALITTQYKNSHIKKFVANYRDSVAPLIMLLKIRADNMTGRIGLLQLQLTHLTDSLIAFAAHKEVKMPVLFAYEQKKKELNAELVAYQQRLTDLDKIITGGQLIVDHVDNLHSQAFKDQMVGLVNAISANVK